MFKQALRARARVDGDGTKPTLGSENVRWEYEPTRGCHATHHWDFVWYLYYGDGIPMDPWTAWGRHDLNQMPMHVGQ